MTSKESLKIALKLSPNFPPNSQLFKKTPCKGLVSRALESTHRVDNLPRVSETDGVLLIPFNIKKELMT
jgi:hypothetical protein